MIKDIHVISVIIKQHRREVSRDTRTLQSLWKTVYSERQPRHIKSVHEKMKYDCYKCEYQAREKSALTKHIQSVHEKMKYGCSLCSYQAT